jgi:hypothetical protein
VLALSEHVLRHREGVSMQVQVADVLDQQGDERGAAEHRSVETLARHGILAADRSAEIGGIIGTQRELHTGFVGNMAFPAR